MKKQINWLILGAATLGMGMGMPSCPGQEEMQKQIDALQTANTELGKKVQTLTTQAATTQKDIDQMKQLLPQMTNVIQAQKGALDQLDASVKEIQAKVMKPVAKKKHK